ncbi:uncharacterized protein LOC132287079 isoform X2 [Cornus florida]|uniref:uncharacterized protein LOC132287079 isoform X2 n=1 Tax=Cornus florida TaxID=4283 RepID=UPI0028A16A76|nr:uncharacterized protein LOC132287079 isoform X2 [Cornus florida]
MRLAEYHGQEINSKVRKRKRTSIENSESFKNSNTISTAKSDAQDMLVEVDSTPQALVHEHPKMDTDSTNNPVKESTTQKKNGRRRKNWKIRERAIGSVENSEVSNNSDIVLAAKSDLRDMLPEANSAPKSPVLEPPKIDTASASNPVKESAAQKKNRRRRKWKIRESAIGSVENLEVSNNIDIVSVAKGDVRDMLPEAKSTSKSPVLEPPKIDTDSADNPVRESAAQKKNRKIRERAIGSVENPEVFNNSDIISVAKSNVQDMPLGVDSATQYPVHQAPKIDTALTNNAIKECPAQIKNRKMREKMKSIETPENNSNISVAMSNVQDMHSAPQYLVHEAPKIDTDLTNNGKKESAPLEKKRRKRRTRSLRMSMDKDSLGSTDQKDILQAVEGSSISGEKKPEVSATESKIERKNRSFDTIVTKHVPLAIISKRDNLLEVSHPLPERSLVNYSRRKLLILDLNGLLADIVFPPPKVCKSDINILGRAVFKRPFCYDFLKFCFEKFDVGIWSSRTKKVIDRVVDYLLGDLKHKLLFCWDLSHSTVTQFKTLENRHKPLVFKELRKVWEKYDSNLPWKKGDYNESNTLLLDDSPYKALLNPMHTAIFPYSYYFIDRSDNSLGPGGDLRVYLENLVAAENIQKYVEHHPFGKNAINDRSPSWGFYNTVISSQLLVPTRR